MIAAIYLLYCVLDYKGKLYTISQLPQNIITKILGIFTTHT